MPIIVGINARESGQPVALTSGTLIIGQSGLNVVIQSGLNVNIGSGIGIIQASGAYIINDSGVRVVIQSGAPVSLQSGLPVNIGSGVGVTIQSISGTYFQLLSGLIVTQSGGFWPSLGIGGGYVPVLPTLASGGATIIMQDVNGRLIVTMSGQNVTTSMSGNAVFVSGTVNILSGAYVNLGSNTVVSIGSGISFQMSGANVIATVTVSSGLGVIPPVFSFINTTYWLKVTGASGGIVLGSGAVQSIALRALPTNSGLILVGGSGASTRPYYVSGAYTRNSGGAIGWPLSPGTAISLKVSAVQSVYVCAQYSGDYIAWVGVI